MDVDDITNFLPKYPNIEPHDPIFNLYPDTNFNESIYKKKRILRGKIAQNRGISPKSWCINETSKNY